MPNELPPSNRVSSPADAPVGHSRRNLLRAMGALLLAASGGLHSTPAQSNDLKVGKPAPPLVLQTLDGVRIATGDLHGQVVILTFWATWCVPCRKELPLLSAYAEHHAARGLKVLAFSLDGLDDLPKVRSVAETLRFPVGLLGNSWAGGYGRIWRIPVSFVIDRAGFLAYNGWEAEDPVWTAAGLQQVVDPLLARLT
ncbi:MAG: TlpA disulfide reductase family protein [Rhodocyclaceae bacterium]|nr:TlpA disulfide reductase family protein [Rhodocyclaceae bacterium]